MTIYRLPGGKTGRRALQGALALGLALALSPAWADGEPQRQGRSAGCDPEVRQALSDAAVSGVERDLAVIRHKDEGIGDPDSLFDLECDIFNFPEFDALVSLPTLSDLLDALKRRACAAAREAWRRNVTRPFDRTVYDPGDGLDRLSGLDGVRRSSVTRTDSEDVFSDVISGGRQ